MFCASSIKLFNVFNAFVLFSSIVGIFFENFLILSIIGDSSSIFSLRFSFILLILFSTSVIFSSLEATLFFIFSILSLISSVSFLRAITSLYILL